MNLCPGTTSGDGQNTDVPVEMNSGISLYHLHKRTYTVNRSSIIVNIKLSVQNILF